jgi:hypothetical protein
MGEQGHNQAQIITTRVGTPTPRPIANAMISPVGSLLDPPPSVAVGEAGPGFVGGVVEVSKLLLVDKLTRKVVHYYGYEL